MNCLCIFPFRIKPARTVHCGVISLKMSISVLDSRLFKDLFGTKEIRAVFDDEAYTRRMVEVEVALARAQSKTGVIPTEAGEFLTKKLTEESFQ